MSQTRHIPHYKTLDIIKFYNNIYDFINRYLIFVFAGIISITAIGVIWLREPDANDLIIDGTQSYKAYYQDVSPAGILIYPDDYYAAKSLTFDKKSKLYAMGGPIWSRDGLINSVNNIVLYNGIILPRQISRSAWVPRFHSGSYTSGMLTTLLEGMGKSQTTTLSIQSDIKKPERIIIEDSLLNEFNITCTQRKLFTYQFCNNFLLQTLDSWYHYDLAAHVDDLRKIHSYAINQGQDSEILQKYCNAILIQYRYDPFRFNRALFQGCDANTIREVEDIANLRDINKSLDAEFNDVIYSNPIMNQYKIMSMYQYLMKKILNNEFDNEKDLQILKNYNSYITKLGAKSLLPQPYADIVLHFHQAYLIPWLESRSAFASSSLKEVITLLQSTTQLLVNGNPSMGFISLSSGSLLELTDPNALPIESIPGEDDTINPEDQDPLPDTISTPTPTNNAEEKPAPSLEQVVSAVIGSTPLSVNKKGNILIVKFTYASINRYASVDLQDQGYTTLYYDSPISGASKIQHSAFLFTPKNQSILHTILNQYISNEL